MRSTKPGKDISVSIENITRSGLWLLVLDKEYFLTYQDHPYFKDQPLSAIQNVQLLHGYHLYWPDLDVDLEIDVLEHPEQYPLRSRTLPSAVREPVKGYRRSGK